MKVAVIGAGVVGLSTALAVQENVHGAQVTVISDLFSPDTTGDAAAGIITPNLLRLKGTSPDLVKEMVKGTFTYFDKILNSPDAMVAGVSRISGYILHRNGLPKGNIYEDVAYCCRPCTENELKSIPENFRYGIFVTTLQIECRRYLPWLLDRIKRNGGQIEERKVNDLHELFGQYDVIVNCAGLGSLDLANDKSVFPVRGQSVKVSAPGVRHFYIDEDTDAAVIPCQEVIHLGSTFQRGDWDTSIRPAERERIIRECKKLVPALEGMTFVRDDLGLRPWREPIRVEREVIPYGRSTQQVVHNYGYSSTGVGLSWGAALYATKIVKEALQMAPPAAKL